MTRTISMLGHGLVTALLVLMGLGLWQRERARVTLAPPAAVVPVLAAPAPVPAPSGFAVAEPGDSWSAGAALPQPGASEPATSYRTAATGDAVPSPGFRLEPAPAPARTPGAAAAWVAQAEGRTAHGVDARRRPGCWTLSGDTLALRITPRMNLSTLAVHMFTTLHGVRRACRVQGDRLPAWRVCRFPLSPRLRPVLHRVQPGETLGELTARYDAPTRFSPRAWNCTNTNLIRSGEVLLFLVPTAAPHQTATSVNAQHPRS